MEGSRRIFFVILAGGSGSRLWPLSRPDSPKHLKTLIGNESLLQQTARRLLKSKPPEQIFVVTRKEHSSQILRQLNEIVPFPPENLLSESRACNTLPAATWAVMHILSLDPEALIGIFPSDHLLTGESAFLEDLDIALKTAEDGWLTTFGIIPTAVETGFGYIRAEEKLSHGVLRAEAFIEKPDAATARDLISLGGHFWNSGILVFKASIFLEEVKKNEAFIWQRLAFLKNTLDVEEVARAYASMPAVSIDHGVMEKAAHIAVVPARFGWSDLGSWEAVYQASEKDSRCNAVQGQVIAEDTSSSLLISRRGTLAVAGLQDMIVVQSGDAILVCPRERAQDVRRISETAERSHISATTHRPWGSYTVLEEGLGYKIKRIVVEPGQKLSLQRHKRRAEHWVIIEGTARVVKDEMATILKKNESTFIPMGAKHRLENPGDMPLVIIEVQTGDYTGEDDIERFEDAYGRIERKT